MKILLSCDMEGISGVVDWNHVDPPHREYERFRRIMTGDVNAAVRGTFDAGADEVIVTDGHDGGRNILIEELDPRVALNGGSPSPLAIVQGADLRPDAAMLIGFHARYGAPDAVLCHTWSGVTRNLWLNDVLVGETGLVAAVCGHFGVPVIMISGDDKVCTEATDLLGRLETAVVKRSLGRFAAECLPLESARKAIYDASVRAVTLLRAGDVPTAYRLSVPVTLRLELMESAMLPRVENVPGTQKLDDTHVEYIGKNILEAFQVFREYNRLGGQE